MRLNPLNARDPQGLFEGSFDAGFRRSVCEFLERDFLEREGIGPSRLGRIAVGDPGFVARCLEHGGEVRLDTADRVLVCIGKPPLRAQLDRELDAFMALTGIKPWVIGWRSVRNASFVQRLRRGGSPYLSTVDRVRGWMHAQLRGRQRQAVFAVVPGEPSFGTVPPRRQPFARCRCPAPAVNRRVRARLQSARRRTDERRT